MDGPGQVAADRRARRASCRAVPGADRSAGGRVVGAGGRGAAFVLACLTLSAFPAIAGLQDDAREGAEKAAYLYKFAPFVDWPDPAAEFPSGEYRICVVGSRPLGGALDRAVKGHTVSGRPIAVHRLPGVDAKTACSVMFVTDPDAKSVAQALAATHGSPVLTVTDGAAGPDNAGIINFVVKDGRVQFEINAQAAAVNRLTISSKLLSLATRVTGPDRIP